MGKVSKAVQQKFPKVTLEFPEPSAFVVVSAANLGTHDKSHGVEPELKVLDHFDAGFGELLQEARRVSGLVRKQWFVAIIWAKPEAKDDMKPFQLGVGLGTDRAMARARALHSAEQRAQILTESMLAT